MLRTRLPSRLLPLLFPTLAALLMGCNGNLLFVPYHEALEVSPPPPPLSEVVDRVFWVVGGQTAFTASPLDFSLVAQIDAFDPVTETWYPNVTTLPTPVTFAGVAAFNGKLFVAGGFNASGSVINTLQIYDIATGQWQTTPTPASMPAARANFDLIAVNGYLYATAGTNANWNAGFSNQSSWLFYNIASNSWSGPTAFSTFYESGQALLVYGLIHQFGGRSAAATLANVHFGFIPNATTATETNTTVEIPITRVGAATGFYAPGSGGTGYILVAGGVNSNFTGTPTAYLFHNNTSPSTVITPTIWYLRAPFEAPAAWTLVGASLPFAICMHTGGVHGDTFWMMGGTKTIQGPSATAEVWKLDLRGFPHAPTSVTAGPPMPVPRFGHKMVKMVY